MDWQEIAGIFAVLGSAAAILGWLWRNVPKAYQRLRYNMFGIGDIKKDICSLTQQMEYLVSELKPNGGGSIRDSLNRIELRQVLQEQRQKAILSDMSVGVFEADNEGDYVWVNRKYLRMTGRTLDEVKGTGWINTVAERHRERIYSEWQDAVHAGREFESEFLLITPENERVEVSVRTYKMSGQDDEPLGFIGVITPVLEGGNIEL